MKKIVLACALVAYASVAHAESITAELTSCSTQEALEAFMGAAFFGDMPYPEALQKLNDAGADCKLETRTFDLVKTVKSFDNKNVTYDLVEIKMDDGTTRYAFHYYPAMKGDKT